MRIILASIGTRGDIQPILALGQALVRRGHEALITCPPSFAAWVRSLGFVHHELGDDMLAELAAQSQPAEGGPQRSVRGIVQYFAKTLPPQFSQLLESARGADALVATGMAISGTSVAEKLSIPVLKLTFSPAALPSSAYPPPFVPWRGTPAWMNRLRCAKLAPDAPRMAKVTAGTFVHAVEKVLALPAAPRQAAAERVRRSDAGGVITSMLESLSKKGSATARS